MGSEWPSVKLSDHCLKIGSGATPRGGSSVYLDEGDISLIRSQNIYNDGFKKDGLVFIDEEAAQKLKNVVVEDKDILLNITGDSVARVCMVDNNFLPARVNQHVAIIRVDTNSFDPQYLRYQLTSPQVQNLLLNLASAGATRNALTKNMIETLLVSKPPLQEQKAIAHILGSLDDKIELNRQMNETLEAMAQALFKSWFVNFDPVIDNALAAGNAIPDVFGERAERRKAVKKDEAINPLFPDAFEYTEEMGWIPEGWQSVTLGDFAEFGNGKKSPDRTNGKIPVFGSNGKIGDCDESNRDNVIIIGRVGTYCGSLQYHPDKCWITDNAMSAEMKEKSSNIFLYQLLLRDNLNDRRTGSGQPLLNQTILRSIKALLPTSTLIVEYSRLSSSFYQKISSIDKNNLELALLRDTLLPKLLSGELRIPDAEKLVEEATG